MQSPRRRVRRFRQQPAAVVDEGAEQREGHVDVEQKALPLTIPFDHELHRPRTLHAHTVEQDKRGWKLARIRRLPKSGRGQPFHFARPVADNVMIDQTNMARLRPHAAGPIRSFDVP
jgi:hypothetical protein